MTLEDFTFEKFDISPNLQSEYLLTQFKEFCLNFLKFSVIYQRLFSQKKWLLLICRFLRNFYEHTYFCLRKDVITSTKSVSSFFRSSVFLKPNLVKGFEQVTVLRGVFRTELNI